MPASVSITEQNVDRSKKNATLRGTANVTLVWAADTVSDEIDLEGFVGVAVHFPSGMPSTTIGFEAKDPGGTWEDITDTALAAVELGPTTGPLRVWMDELLPYHKIRITSSAALTLTSYLDLKA